MSDELLSRSGPGKSLDDAEMLIVLADDLTGAASSAALLCRRGLRVRIINTPSLTHEAGVDALVVNTRTRDLAEGDASKTLESCLDEIHSWDLATTVWSKRIDTTLRGPVRAELRVLLKRLKPRGGILAPAYPEANRLTRGAMQFADGKEVGNLRSLLSDLPGVEQVRVGGDFADVSGGWWIPDIEGPADLMSAVAHVAPHLRDLLIVDSGLMIAAAVDSSAAARRVLVVLGSGAELTDRQQRRLVWSGRTGVKIVYQPLRGKDDGNLEVLAKEVKLELRRVAYAGIVSGGGLTSEAIVEVLGCRVLKPIGSPEPLVGLSRLLGGEFDGLLLATKGGGVGGVTSLVRLVDLIQMWSDR